MDSGRELEGVGKKTSPRAWIRGWETSGAVGTGWKQGEVLGMKRMRGGGRERYLVM